MKAIILAALVLLSGCALIPKDPVMDPVNIQEIVDASITRTNALYAEPHPGDETYVWKNERGNVEMTLIAAKVFINLAYEIEIYKAMVQALQAENQELRDDLAEENAKKWRWLKNGVIGGTALGAAVVITIMLLVQ